MGTLMIVILTVLGALYGIQLLVTLWLFSETKTKWFLLFLIPFIPVLYIFTNYDLGII